MVTAIENTDSQALRALWMDIEDKVKSSLTLEGAGQQLVQRIYEGYPSSVALCRMFLTVPFGRLPEGHQSWVRALVEGAGAAEELTDKTPCLSLVGSYGDREEWCDRRRSRGHVAIPLLSPSFVDGIPMIARLLKELGVPMEWIEKGDTEIVRRTIGDMAGVFHVDDATVAEDHRGRKIIAAQDFVTQEGIQSVFGIGGAYFGGSIVVVIVFCRRRFDRVVATRFLPLVNFFKSRTTSVASPGRVFTA